MILRLSASTKYTSLQHSGVLATTRPGEADPTTDYDLPRKVRSAQIPSSRKT